MKKSFIFLAIIFFHIAESYGEGTKTNHFELIEKENTLEGCDLHNSTDGSEIELHIDSKTKDSILTVTYYGETFKHIYKFVFNKKLTEAEGIRYNYAVPIYLEPQPKIMSIEKETLKTSEDAKKNLIEIFFAHKKQIAK